MNLPQQQPKEKEQKFLILLKNLKPTARLIDCSILVWADDIEQVHKAIKPVKSFVKGVGTAEVAKKCSIEMSLPEQSDPLVEAIIERVGAVTAKVSSIEDACFTNCFHCDAPLPRDEWVRKTDYKESPKCTRCTWNNFQL